jgi:hypothetical protein
MKGSAAPLSLGCPAVFRGSLLDDDLGLRPDGRRPRSVEKTLVDCTTGLRHSASRSARAEPDGSEGPVYVVPTAVPTHLVSAA